MTEFLADDEVSMNRINPYTATQTFGIPSDGGSYVYTDMQWKTPVDETSAWDETDSPEFLDHFNSKALNKSGPMYLKTGSVEPASSFMFPARKVQYDDGTTNWSREIIWKNGENYISQNLFGQSVSMYPVFLFLLILLLVLFVAAKMLKV